MGTRVVWSAGVRIRLSRRKYYPALDVLATTRGSKGNQRVGAAVCMAMRALVLAACLLYSGCTPVSDSPQQSPSASLTVGSCSKQTATRLVEDFFARWNNHDAAGTAGLFSSTVSFNDNIGDKRTT